MNKEKILFIATIEDHIRSFHIPFINLLKNKGYEVHIATRLSEEHFHSDALGCTWHNVNFFRSPLAFGNIKALHQLVSLMKSLRFSLVHVHTPMGSFLGRVAAKLTGTKPVVYTAHGFHFYPGAPRINWLLYYNVEKFLARWTDGLMVINSEDKLSADKMNFKLGQNLFFVHGVGVSTNIIFSEKQTGQFKGTLGFKPDDVIVTIVAELNTNKNHQMLLKAWKQVSVNNERGQLLIVGDGILASKLKKQVEDEKIPRVHFLGYRKDVDLILSISDISVLVSLREGLPRCLMEAMALGKPIVATDIRGCRDLVTHGKNGYLVEVNKINELSEKLIDLINNKETRTIFGENSRKFIKPYDLENVCGEMKDIYEMYLK